jgi:hypothetical protein
LAQVEGATIISRPTKRIKELRRELKESNARLQSVKNGRPLGRAIDPSPNSYELEEPRSLQFNSPDFFFPPKAEYLYPRGAVARNSAAAIRNEFNFLRHAINEDDRKRNNKLITDMNRRNRRRPYAIAQQFADFGRYGIEEARRRAERADRLSALKEKRNEDWWVAFVVECGEALDDLRFLQMIADAKSFGESAVRAMYTKAVRKRRDSKMMRQLLERVNQVALFLPDFRMKRILDTVEEKVGKV